MKNVTSQKKSNNITILDIFSTINIKDIIISVMFILFTIMTIVTIKTLVVNKSLVEEGDELFNIYTELSLDYDFLEKKYVNLTNNNTISEQKYNKAAETIRQLNEVINELDKQNKALVASNEEYNKKITEYREREELLNKYEYAIFDDENKRTDITYDQLKTAEELCKENGIDTNFILATIMVESSGNEKCTSKISTARGYGQFLAGTGKYTYEDLMGNGKGTYNHDMALDGDTNIEMMVSYFKYLKSNTKSIYATINRYRGLESPSYQAAINKYLLRGGTSLSQLNVTY